MLRTKDYKIRAALEKDVAPMTALGKQFVEESINFKALGWSSTKTHQFFLDAVSREDFGTFVLCNEDEVVGMFVCLVAPCFFSDAIQAVEIAWYVTQEHRGSREALKMLDHYEEWAIGHGAACMSLMNVDTLNGPKVGRLYSRKGYTLAENTFVKEL